MTRVNDFSNYLALGGVAAFAGEVPDLATAAVAAGLAFEGSAVPAVQEDFRLAVAAAAEVVVVAGRKQHRSD